MATMKCSQRKYSTKTTPQESFRDIDLSAIDNIVNDICCKSKKSEEIVVDIKCNNDNNNNDDNIKVSLQSSRHSDPLEWSPYVEDILLYQKQKEKDAVLPTNYLDKHDGITKTVREILVDWLLQVQTYMRLQDDSLDLSVALADQYLARKTLELSSVQLLGITCLFIASKWEELMPPTMHDLCFLTSNTYTPAQLREMEKDVLATLNFSLCFPSAKGFLVRYLDISQQGEERNEENLCKYLLDLSLIDIQQCAFTSSEKAASAVCLTRKILHADDSNAWTAELQRVSGFSEAVLGACQTWLTKLMVMQATNKQKGITCKYKKLLQATSSKLQTWIQTHS